MSSALASPANNRSTFQSLIDTATRGLKDGHLGDALDTCRTLTETYPDQPDSWFLFGATALEAEDIEAAIPALERANTQHRAHAGYKRLLARAYRLAGRTEDAARVMEEALRLEPTHPEASLTLGVIKIAQGETTEGMQFCRNGLQATAKLLWHRVMIKLACQLATLTGSIRYHLSPGGDRMAWVAWERGRFCHGLGNNEEATKHFRKAASLAPDQMPLIAELAKLLIARNQHTEAFPYLERAAKYYIDDLALQTDYAALLTHMARFDDAIDILENMFSSGIESPRALLTLGKAQAGMRKDKAARKSYKRALTLAPNSASAHAALGQALQEEGAIGQANRYFFDTLAIDPARADAYLFLASNKAISVGDKHFARILDLLDSGTACRDAQIRLHLAAAAIYEQAGDIRSAATHCAVSDDLKGVALEPGQDTRKKDGLDDFFDQVRSWGHPEGYVNNPMHA